jgi:hypothetical protein
MCTEVEWLQWLDRRSSVEGHLLFPPPACHHGESNRKLSTISLPDRTFLRHGKLQEHLCVVFEASGKSQQISLCLCVLFVVGVAFSEFAPFQQMAFYSRWLSSSPARLHGRPTARLAGVGT